MDSEAPLLSRKVIWERTEGLCYSFNEGILLQDSHALQLWAGGAPLSSQLRLLVEGHIIVFHQLRGLPVRLPQRLQCCNARVPTAQESKVSVFNQGLLLRS